MAQTLSLKILDQCYTMKQSYSIFLVLIYLFYSGKCKTVLPSETPETSENLFPEDNIIADLLKYLNKTYNREYVHNNVIFQLYTRSQSTTYTTLRPTEETDVGDFNNQRETKFIIHDRLSGDDNLALIREEYLEAGDYNVIVVDWSKPAQDSYTRVINLIKMCGEYLASLIDFLVTYHDLRLEDVHIVGYSLGAHIAGVAGNRIKSGKPGRITGLDPSAFDFCFESLENRLDFTDGEFVDVIHTCGELIGWKSPIGHADFYPNGGTATQPGCDVLSEEYEDSASCSHSRALEYFAESITTTTGFVSYQCPSWDDFKHGKCFQNSTALMGEFADTSYRGSYYLQTANSSPYALGNISTVVEVESDEITLQFGDFIIC